MVVVVRHYLVQYRLPDTKGLYNVCWILLPFVSTYSLMLSDYSDGGFSKVGRENWEMWINMAPCKNLKVMTDRCHKPL
jgi:hypothetical protein